MKVQSLVLLCICAIALSSCRKEQKSAYVEIELGTNWELRSSDDSIRIEASVPGSLLGDLYKNEKIENPYIADNINTLQWIDKKQWTYSVEFDVPTEIIKMDSVSLRFNGLKGVAAIVLNDTLLGTVYGYFNTQSFTCKNNLKVRGNRLLIRFRSVEETINSLSSVQTLNENEEERVIDPYYPIVFQGTAASPELLSCGIFEPVKLVAWSTARIKDVFVFTDSINPSYAVLKVESEIEAVDPGKYQLDVYVNDQKVDKTQTISLKSGAQKYEAQISIPNPELWWCNGKGKPAIYKLTVALHKEKRTLHTKETTFGIRKVELSNVLDSARIPTYFRLNGKPVFLKGANYLPLNLFQLESNAENYENIISKAAAANMNVLRVWGGGVYEKNLFYDLCDKYGIMVWQDIVVPDIDNITNKIYQPASIEHNLKRLRNHPSVIIFYTSLEQMNTVPPYSLQADDKEVVAADEFLRNLLQNITPHIPYYSALQSDDFTSYWPVWYNSSPITAYTSHKVGIVTEFGMQSIPDFKTAQSFNLEDEFDLRSPVTLAHQFNNITWLGSNLSGNQMLGAYLQMYYNDPVSNEALLYLSQVFQAEALKYAIGNFRINKPSCMGSIFWHFNDCWPSISWSVIDFYNRNKPAYYTVRKAYQNIAVVPERKGDLVKLWVVNDSLVNMKGILSLKIIDFNGSELYHHSQDVDISSDEAAMVYEKYASGMFPNKLSNKVLMYVTFSVNGKVVADNTLYFVDPLFLDLPEPDINMQITNKDNRFQLIFRSSTLVKNLVVFTRNKESYFSDNNIDLLPGVTYTINANYDGTPTDIENDLQVITLVDSF